MIIKVAYNDKQISMLGMARLLLVSVCAALFAACIPHPGGQCSTDNDCGYGLACTGGLCETRAPRTCSDPCASGLHCDDGTCALDAPPSVSWVSPSDGQGVATGAVSLALSISTPAPAVTAAVRLTPLNGVGVSTVLVPVVLAADGLYRGLFDAGALEERDWKLEPVILAAGQSYSGGARRIRIDRTGPHIELSLPTPRGANFLRTETIEIRARIIDDGVGIDAATPVVVAPGMLAISGTRLSAQEWSFRVPLAAPDFLAGTGPLALGVRARDLLGNEATMNGAVPVTRALWSRSVGGGLPIRSSPVIDAHHLFIGTDAGNILSLDRATAAPLWSRTLAGPVSASPARGAHALYAASEGGEVRAIDPDTGALLWSCADLPTGLSFRSSPAIASIAGIGSSGVSMEAIALVNTGTFMLGSDAVAGGLFLLEGTTGFVRANGMRSCTLFAPVSGGRTSPAIDLDGTIYVGGDDSKAHALGVSSDAQGRFAFIEKWSVATGAQISASPALGADGIAFADESGRLLMLAANGAPRATPAPLADKVLSSPVFAFGTLLALDDVGSLAPTANSSAAAAPPAYAPISIAGAANVESTPAVGADGTVYLAAERTLYAFAPAGGLLWSLPLPGAATASSPTIGCDGTLYLGDAAGFVSSIATDSRGLAPGWSRFGHDARGTGNASMGACE